MTDRLARFRALSWPERKILLQAVLLLPLFWPGLRVFGFSHLHAWVARSSAAVADSRPDVEPARIGTLINIAGAHLPFPSTCLTRSLLLLWMLGRRGLHSELRIGVRRTDVEIESHAWVELDGEPVNETREVVGRFAAFDAPLPSGSGSFS